MTVRLLELHKRYMQDGLFDDPNFTNSIVDESVVDKQWTLRRSYTHEGHTREEHFDIQLFDEDNIPHVRCSLRLVTRGHEALQDDIRWKIFKPGMWIGPQLEVEAVQQQFIAPQDLLIPSTHQRTSETNNFTPQVLRTDASSSSTVTHGRRTSLSDPFRNQASTKNQNREMNYDSAEYRILAAAREFRDGCRILVGKPQQRPLERLDTIRRCFEETEGKDRPLIAVWRELKENGTPTDEIYPETCSHVKTLKKNVATIECVAKYMAGIKANYCLKETDRPATLFHQNTRKFRSELAFKRVRTLISRLSAFYPTTAGTTFTFLAVGGFKFTNLGRVAVGDEPFLYDGLLALFDLLLLRLATTAEETEQESIPVINPIALLCWYEGGKRSYKDTCKEFDLSGFNSATKEMCSEEHTSTIFRQICRRLKHIDAEREINNEVEHTENESGECVPNKSMKFILKNAQRLAKYIPREDKEIFTETFKGGVEDIKNMRLALRIVNGEVSHEDALAVSIDVVYRIVDILLYTRPKTKQKSESKEGVKRKRAVETDASESTSFDTSNAHHSQEVPAEENQDVSESQNLTTGGEWGGSDITEGMAVGAMLPTYLQLNQTVEFASPPSQFCRTIDQSQFISQFGTHNFPTGTDFGGMDINDALSDESQHVFSGAWARPGPPTVVSQTYPNDGFMQANFLGGET